MATQTVVFPDDHAEMRRAWSHCLRAGCAGEGSLPVRNAEGGYRWFHSRVEPLRASGTLLYRIGVTLDIKDRKQAEFYLAEGQRPAHMGSWAFDAAGFDYWSPELFRIHGLNPNGKAPTVQEYMNLVHPEDRGFVGQAIQKVFADHRGFDFTKRIVRPDGTIRSKRCVGVPATQGETFLGFVGTGMDVTEQEQLTKERQRREAYLAKAQRLSHTGTFGWNVSTDEHFWSEETFRIFEFAPSSKVSLQMILVRIHPEDMPSVKMAITAATRGERIDLEYRLLMSDGRIKYLHVVGEAERRETGGLEVIGAVMDVTARKLTEVELRRSKAHLADAQRLSRTGSVGMDGTTKRIFWSEEAARIYGYPPGAEPTPELILQRVHPDDVDLLKNVLERAAQGGSDFDFEHRLLMPEGSIKHIHNLSHYLRDKACNEEVVGAIMDVTERKLAEEAIRRSEACLAEAQRLSHTGSFGWKVSGGEIFWSDESFRIFQCDPDTKPTLEFALTRVHPKDRELVQQQIERASRDGKAFDFENRLQMPDGSMSHVRVTAHPSRDGAGNLEFVGAVTDVSDHRQAEAMIRERQSELQQILDLAPQHIGVFGPDGSPLYANRATLEYLGVGIDRWRDETARYSLVHPDDRERFLGERKRRFLEGAPHEFEVRLLGHDGKFRWFLFRLNPLKDERGQITRWYSTGIDIEERKQAEDTLRHENVALREEIDRASMFEEIIGASPALQTVLSRISKVAPSDSTVLITGETGTGKELVARAIHRRSNRASRAFVSVNCAAVPRDLIASELFGHEKGAFTGATQQRLGRFELASGGTIFLDEVGELPAETQLPSYAFCRNTNSNVSAVLVESVSTSGLSQPPIGTSKPLSALDLSGVICFTACMFSRLRFLLSENELRISPCWSNTLSIATPERRVRT